MITVYLVLAGVLAATLNHASRFVRAAGTWAAAGALCLIAVSIGMADRDGIFAALPSGFAPARAVVLNAEGCLASLAAVFLLWAGWRQTRRLQTGELGWRNRPGSFGLVSRAAHWASATLVVGLVPIGLFITLLPAASTDRREFVTAHETLGVVLLVLVLARLAWLGQSRPPALPASLTVWERRAARLAHPLLYALMVALPASGILMLYAQGGTIDLFGWRLPMPAHGGADRPSVWAVLHHQVLPIVFGLAFAAHLGAVLKHHFLDGRTSDVRRMAR